MSIQRDTSPSYSEQEMLRLYMDANCPYPCELEVHTRTSERPSVTEPRPAPRHARNFRADMVVQMPETEVAVEAKQFNYKPPWIEKGHIYDGIGQTLQYSKFYDLAELWHFVHIPRYGLASRDEELVANAERQCKQILDYFHSWFDGEVPFGYRLIGITNREDGVEHQFACGSSAVELGYNPEARSAELDYPFRTNYDDE